MIYVVYERYLYDNFKMMKIIFLSYLTVIKDVMEHDICISQCLMTHYKVKVQTDRFEHPHTCLHSVRSFYFNNMEEKLWYGKFFLCTFT